MEVVQVSSVIDSVTFVPEQAVRNVNKKRCDIFLPVQGLRFFNQRWLGKRCFLDRFNILMFIDLAIRSHVLLVPIESAGTLFAFRRKSEISMPPHPYHQIHGMPLLCSGVLL